MSLDLIIMVQIFSILSDIFFVLLKTYVKIAYYDFGFVFFLYILPIVLKIYFEIIGLVVIIFKLLQFSLY